MSKPSSASSPSPAQPEAQRTGGEAEALAEQFLRGKGLKMVARNVRCRGGELDLVMQDGRTLVFVEVRLRTHKGFGTAAESVAARKQQRVILAAQHYLMQRSDTPPCRFDVIALDGLSVERIEWIRDAFSPERRMPGDSSTQPNIPNRRFACVWPFLS